MEWIILLIMLILILYFNQKEKKMCSNNDGQCYKIVTSFDNQIDALNELSRINSFNAHFIKYLRNKYLWSSSTDKTMKDITQNLINNYNPDVLKENNPHDTNNTSYVLAKGRSIAFCLREKDTGQNLIEDENMLNFVNIHEISHLAMSYHDPEHGTEFWSTFRLLLKEAALAGLYKPIDWSKYPKNYCGMKVNYNPFFDNENSDSY